jgi:8-oxo-dGTP pyrophosphatase MutT (NUDIX family)
MTKVSGETHKFKSAFVVPIVESPSSNGRATGVLFISRKDPIRGSDGSTVYKGGVLDLPGGSSDNGLAPNYAEAKAIALREMKEETDLDVDSERLEPFAAFRSADGNEVAYYVLRMRPEELSRIFIQYTEHLGACIVGKELITGLLSKGDSILDMHADVAALLLDKGYIRDDGELNLHVEERAELDAGAGPEDDDHEGSEGRYRLSYLRN